jgi:hypothetical protein
MATVAEIAAGEAALKAFVNHILAEEGKSWEAWFIPEAAYRTGAVDVIHAADGCKDQDPVWRQTAGQNALRVALNSTGQGGQVTDAQCAGGARAILAALDHLRVGHHPGAHK